jgi:4-amino-4-deoxy-L-arabinose transferase-like glycosyltransferase
MFVTRMATGARGSRPRIGPRWRWLLAPLLLLLLPVLLRAIALRASVVDPDEGLYLVQAIAWLKGGWPYLAVWDMHPVGAPALLTAAVALVPGPLLALRLAGMVAVAATALLLMRLLLRLGASRAAGFAAGLLYACHTLVLGGLATNTEILFAPFMVAGATLILAETLSPRAPRPGRVFLGGLCFGGALWVKQVVGLEASALWLTLAGVALAEGRAGIRQVLWLALVFALGCALPTALTAAAYAAMGAFGEWWNSNVTVLLTYAAVEDGSPGLRRGLAAVLGFLLWLLAAAALLALAPRPALRRAALLLPWLGAAAMQAIAPGKYFDHYFLMLLPPLCALAALGLEAAALRAARRGTRAAAVVALAAAIAALPVATVLLPRLGHGFGWRIPDPPAQVAAIARAEVSAGEALYVANWHPVVYALAGLDPPTRFAFPTHLAGLHAPLTGFDQDAELARVLALPPRIIVIAPSRWWLVRPEARATIEAALVGYDRIAAIPDGEGLVEVWRRR